MTIKRFIGMILVRVICGYKHVLFIELYISTW